jgi:fructose-1-phosphate kinase PfkB-like protein
VIYADDGCIWSLKPPQVQTVNAVGSGDAFAAGFLAGTGRRLSVLDAVALGIACGASNAIRLEPDIGPPEEIEDLAGRVRVNQLSG